MLEELYQYAQKHGITARPGFKFKPVKAYVCLDRSGNLIGIDPAPAESVLCPDIGSGAQGSTQCNVPVEKALISLPVFSPKKAKPQKHTFFLQMLTAAASQVPEAEILRAALTSSEIPVSICEALKNHKISPEQMIGYKIDGVPLESLESFQTWWASCFAENSSGKKKANRVRCLITGELITPVETVPPITGLISVGGHARGDRLICFDKDAFCSYGQKQANNAPVSEEAMGLVNSALEKLMAQAPSLKGLTAVKWLHWYKKDLPPKYPDPLHDLWGDDQNDETEEDEEPDFIRASAAESQVQALLTSYQTGVQVDLSRNEYYILALSGAGGRVMIRGWQQGNFRDLQAALDAWWADLSLNAPFGGAPLPHPRLSQLTYRLLKPMGNSQRSVHDRFREELSSLEPRLMFAIINHTALPNPAAEKALRTIRSGMISGSDSDTKHEPVPDARACQLLKAWLRRGEHKEKGGIFMQPGLNPDYPNAAYHCGRLMAVYAAIQTAAMRKRPTAKTPIAMDTKAQNTSKAVNAGVVERYYAAASRTPALAIGNMNRLSCYHLSKLERDNPVLASYFKNLLGEIALKIALPLPSVLDLQGQTEFALGYQQQYAVMHSNKNKNTTKDTASATEE